MVSLSDNCLFEGEGVTAKRVSEGEGRRKRKNVMQYCCCSCCCLLCGTLLESYACHARAERIVHGIL